MSVPLSETGWKVMGTDEDASATFFKTILSHLVGVYIATEWHEGDDSTNVDNVTLNPR